MSYVPGEVDERKAVALERIATALEQMMLETIEPPRKVLNAIAGAAAEPPPSPEFAAALPLTPIMAPLPPVTAPAAPQPPQVRYAAGMNHAAGHKPLKENNRGLYCPTKLPDGSWCQFTARS